MEGTANTGYVPMQGQQTGVSGSRKVFIGLAVLCLVGAVFLAAAEGAPEWSTWTLAPYAIHYGLWKACVDFAGVSTCQSYSSLETASGGDGLIHWGVVESVRGFSVVAIIASILGLGAMAGAAVRDDWKLARLAFVVQLVTALAALLAVVQWARWQNYANADESAIGGPALKYGASFGLEVVGFLLSLLVAAGVFVAGVIANRATN